MTDRQAGIAANKEAIAELLKQELASKSSHEWKEPGNKYDHGVRTAKLTLHLRELIFPDTDDPALDEDILTVAAWFHDICNGQDDHERAGAEYIETLLAEYCTAEELAAVCGLVRVHDHRTTEPEKTMPDAVKLLQDADMLDHLGTYDVWITFCEFCHQHRTPMEYAEQFTNGVFDRFAAHWRSRMNYPQSLEIFEEKIAFECAFARRMLRELNGEFC